MRQVMMCTYAVRSPLHQIDSNRFGFFHAVDLSLRILKNEKMKKKINKNKNKNQEKKLINDNIQLNKQ